LKLFIIIRWYELGCFEGKNHFSLLGSCSERSLGIRLLGRNLRPLNHQLVLLWLSGESHDLKRRIGLDFDESKDGLDTIALVVRCFHLECDLGFESRDDLDRNRGSGGGNRDLSGIDIQ
ncbi:hypothetical protein PFISCL1PPCAC_16488, partial [Pristionchus fissidentatus]